MIRKLTLTCVAWLCTFALYSQCDLPAPAGPDCGSATFFCNGEVDGFCSTLPPNGNPAGPNPLCNGAGVPNNTEWIAFAAGTTNITFNITPSNCDIVNNGGQQFTGVQAGIYSDCSFSNALTCVGACQTNTFSLGSASFVVGQVYYIFLDGCAGSVCDYAIDVTSGSTVSPPPGLTPGPTGSTAPCTNAGSGANVFTIPAVSFANLYDWTITPNVPFIQNGNSITVTDWNGATSVTICVEASNDCNPAPAGNEMCTTFNITPITPIDPPPGTYCENEGGYLYNGTLYQAPGSPYSVPLLSYQGCDSTVMLNVVEFLNTDSQMEATVCVGECVTIDNQDYCVPVNGIPIPVSTPNFRGCDSTVFLTLEVLDPMVNISGDLNLDCGETETILFANVSNSPNPNYTWSYLWSTANGSTSNGIFDQNILLVNSPGDYEVEVTLTTPDGVACSVMSIPVTVTETADVPTTVTSSTDAPCSGTPSGTASVTASGGGGGPYTYVWDPSGQMTQTATNLTSGWYYVTVTSSNGCTALDSVEVATSAAVSLTVDNVVDVLCNGEATGSGTVSGSGGTPGYTYLWDPSTGGTGQTTSTASNLTAGIYTVTITDDAGCTDTQTITITEPDVLAFTSTTSPASCDGDDSGQAWVNPLGGTAGYTYLWDSGALSQTTDTAFNLPAGLYSVTITDANNCTQVINNIEVTDPDAISLTNSTVDVLCNGDATGSATINPNGGTPTYTYLWNTTPAQMGATATNLPAGIYSVTVTDFNGCTEVQSGIVINEAPAMTGTASVTDAGCNGSSTGSISVTATGTGTLSYNWSGAASGTLGPVANNLPADTYSVTITDSNNCTFEILNIVVGEPNAVTATISTSQDILCFGESTGSATAQGGGGSGTYTYLWSPNAGSAISQTVNNLPADTYMVTITDGAGCTETTSITLNEPTAALNITEVAVIDASCTSNDGSIDIDVTGGTVGYTYLWTPGGSTDQDPQNLAGGSYTVVVTDNNGCTAEFSTTVNIPGGLTASADATPLSCYGDTNSDIDVTVSGGTGTLTYQWNQVGFGNNQDISSVGPGTYIVTITDANSCSVQTSVIITEPDSISIPLVQVTQASCGLSDGSIDLFVTGGTAGYTYAWSGGADPVSNPMNLSAGPYDVTITDANGCVKDTTIMVTVPDGPVLSTITADPVRCNGESSGAINLDFAGGQSPYTYDWTGTAFDGIEDPTNVPAGIYDVTVTDINNCELITSVTVTEPAELTAVATTTDVLCNGDNSGTATINPSGGTVGNGYTYLWCDGQTTQTAINCPAGVCSVTVTDDNGCTFITDVTVNEPTALTASVSTVTAADCNGTATGSIDLTTSGGTGAYTYAWTGGADPVANPQNLAAGSYEVTITDANGCEEVLSSIVVQEPAVISITDAISDDPDCSINNGSISITATGGNGGFTYAWTGGAAPVSNPSNLGPGTYDLIITDALGCTKDTSITLVTPDGPVLDDISAIDVACNGESTGAVNVDFTGGQAPYDFDWPGTAYDGLEDLTNVPAGLYEVTITDDNNCSTIASVMVNEPLALDATTSAVDVLCNGTNTGTASVTASGGASGYTYLWCDGQTTDVATNLPQGMCSVTVTDANNCTFVADVMVNEPPVLSASLNTVNPATCNGTATGSIDLTVGGGAGTYTYAWTGGADPVSNPQNLPAGFYDVTVTDLNGCEEVLTAIEVTEPDPITFTSSSIEATCNQSNGSISIIPAGGNGNYTYAWSGGADPVSDPQNLSAGTYDLTITDMLGCTAVGQVEVTTPSALSVQVAQTTDANCFGEASGSIVLSVTGGSPGYTYAWTGGLDPVANPTNVPAGTYDVDITDLDGCVISASAIVGEPPLLEISVIDVVAATCNQNNGSIDIDVTGGVAPYTYLWNNGDVNQDPANLSPGLADVLVTDANGCTSALQIPVTEPGALAVAPATVGVSCNSATDGSITLSASGGNGPYTYIWNIPGVGNVNSVSNLGGGTYSAIVVDADGCQFPLPSLVVAEPDVLVQDGILPTDASCLANDGSIDVSFIGGTGSYTYSWTSSTSPFTSNLEDLTNLSPGEYQVVVTDANNCSTTVQGIMIGEPTPPTLTTDSLRVRCFGEANGGISLVVNNPNGAVNYAWSDPSIGNVQNPTGLSAGMYQVTVTDAENCVTTASIEVTQPDTLVAATLAPNDVSCNGGSNGSATVTEMGGTPGYSYLWNNGAMVPDPSGLEPGVYTVVVTDANGCTAEAATTVSEPPLLEVLADATDTRCDNESNGAIDLTSSGGTGSYQFDWNDDQYDGLEDLSNLPAGTYLVTVTDDNGCTQTLSAEVMAPPAVIVRIEEVSDYSGFNVSCANIADGSITVQGTGGNGGPFGILWNDGSTTETISDLPAGDYSVIVTDQLGCTSEELFNLTSPDPIVFSPTAQAVSCYGDDDGAIVIEDPIGGTGPYVYSLDDSPFGAGIFTALSAGNYQVLVQDANGCEEMQVISVQEPTEVLADLGGDIEIQLGDSVYLLAQTSASSLDTFYWTQGFEALNCIDCNGQWVTPTSTTTFGVYLEDANGCGDDDQIQIRVRKDRLVYIPSGFSPSSTGGNEVFTIFGGQGVAKVNKFVIADRWGEIVYSAINFLPNDPAYGWDGTFRGAALNSGVFVYFAEIEFTDGRKEIFKGDVTLIK